MQNTAVFAHQRLALITYLGCYLQNPVVFMCWFTAVVQVLAPMGSISADLHGFCSRMTALEFGLQAALYALAFLLGLLGPANFFEATILCTCSPCLSHFAGGFLSS